MRYTPARSSPTRSVNRRRCFRGRFGMTSIILLLDTPTRECFEVVGKQLFLEFSLPNGLPMECQGPSSTLAHQRGRLLGLALGSEMLWSGINSGVERSLLRQAASGRSEEHTSEL